MATGKCSCGATFLIRGGRGRPPRHCSKACRDRVSRQTDAGKARMRRGHEAEKKNLVAKVAARVRNRARAKRPGRMFDKHYRTVVMRGSYTGSLEEYAEHIERVRMGCGRADSWAGWVRAGTKPRAPGMYAALSSAEYYKHRYHSDPSFRLRERMRRQFKKWLKGERRLAPSFLGALDYTWEGLRAHVERQFKQGMSWDNMDEWHLDHIVPKSTFDPLDAEQVKACWAMGNLRPIWASENLRKGSRRMHLL